MSVQQEGFHVRNAGRPVHLSREIANGSWRDTSCEDCVKVKMVPYCTLKKKNPLPTKVFSFGR